jgi:diguanylate cyclase (GGDEF)-like protein
MQMADEEGITFDCIHMRKDGSNFPVEVSAKSISTENGRFRIHIIRDITARIKSQERIAWLANNDPLTEIPNRTKFRMRLDEELERSMRNKKPFAVMLFDIDKFKHINDHYGHDTGDFVLKHVALTVQSVLRAGDMVARFGGDEFVVIQTEINGRDEVEALASRILESVAKTVSYESMTKNISISIGISMFPNDAIEARALMHCADMAMYKAKRNGGASYCFFTPCYPPCSENRLCLDCDR